LWLLLAQFIHPYLHLRYRDVIDRGPFVVRVLAKTAYFKGTSKNIRLRRDDRRLRSLRCRFNGCRPFIETI
jgi:hypothetical protein